jgi:hypothetical protein
LVAPDFGTSFFGLSGSMILASLFGTSFFGFAGSTGFAFSALGAFPAGSVFRMSLVESQTRDDTVITYAAGIFATSPRSPRYVEANQIPS